MRRSTGDPAFARYVATVDLIAAHCSYDAAEVLLRQLLEVRPQGPIGRALAAAMARSPNAVRADGLLEALEGGFDPEGMAAAAEVLDGGARSPPRRSCASCVARSTSLRSCAAIVALGRVGDQSAVDVLLPLLDCPTWPVKSAPRFCCWVSGVVSMLGRRRWHAASNAPRSLGEIVGRHGGPNYLLLLYRAVEAKARGVGAIMTRLLREPRAVGRLIDVLAGRDPVRAQVASGALELITGHHEDPEESLLRNRWMTWWDRTGTTSRKDSATAMVVATTLDFVERLRPRIPRAAHLVRRAGDLHGCPSRVRCGRAVSRAALALPRVGDVVGCSAAAYPSGGWFFHGERIG